MASLPVYLEYGVKKTYLNKICSLRGSLLPRMFYISFSKSILARIADKRLILERILFHVLCSLVYTPPSLSTKQKGKNRAIALLRFFYYFFWQPRRGWFFIPMNRFQPITHILLVKGKRLFAHSITLFIPKAARICLLYTSPSPRD